jgi:hypothetical protein
MIRVQIGKGAVILQRIDHPHLQQAKKVLWGIVTIHFEY